MPPLLTTVKRGPLCPVATPNVDVQLAHIGSIDGHG